VSAVVDAGGLDYGETLLPSARAQGRKFAAAEDVEPKNSEISQCRALHRHVEQTQDWGRR
jgi:hypothetical protein